jgi:UDP-glucose 4-epimerase
MLFAFRRAKEVVNIFNLGSDDDIRMAQIAKIVIQKSGLKNVTIRYTGGCRGWRGDVPLMLLDTKKMKTLGWQVKYGSKEVVEKAVEDLLNG